MTVTADPQAPGVRWHRLVLLLPFVWQLGLAGWANGIAWRPLGLPFQMVWQMAGIFVASLSIAFVYRRDEGLSRAEPDAP